MSWRGPLFISTICWAVGAAFLLWPQSVFRYRFAPLGPPGDGLTEAGERSYRRFGIFLVLVGFGIAVWGLTL